MRPVAILVLTGALVIAGGTTATALAGSPAHKTTICHRANAHKYVAITVSNASLKKHLANHSDVIGPPVPQGNMAAARAFCAALPILTPKQGGRKLKAMFTNTLPGVNATLDVRLRVGQGQLCFNLSATGSTVSSATITAAGSTVTLAPLPVSPATTSSGCVNLNRSVVKAILQSPNGVMITITTAAGTLTGSFGKK